MIIQSLLFTLVWKPLMFSQVFLLYINHGQMIWSRQKSFEKNAFFFLREKFFQKKNAGTPVGMYKV